MGERCGDSDQPTAIYRLNWASAKCGGGTGGQGGDVVVLTAKLDVVLVTSTDSKQVGAVVSYPVKQGTGNALERKTKRLINPATKLLSIARTEPDFVTVVVPALGGVGSTFFVDSGLERKLGKRH